MSIKKKVLILGGIKQMIQVVEAAKRMGLYTIVTDNGLGASAKRHADQYYDFPPSDIANLAKVVMEEKVEGIFTSINDINIWNALKLCKTADLPLYTTREQLKIPLIKDKLIEFCEVFNVSVLEEPNVMGMGNSEHVSNGHPGDLTFLFPWEREIERCGGTSSSKVKLYYTLHRKKSIWEKRRPFSFTKGSARKRYTSVILNKTASSVALQR